MNVINDIFQEFRKNKSNMEMSIEEFKDNISKFKDRIVLYGAGSSGIAFLYFLRYQGIEPIYFIDADKKKQGNMCENLRILSPKDGVKVVGNNCLVIVCINKCLWSHNTNLNLYAFNGPGSFVSSIGKQKTEAITIDKLMNNKKVSFIKMNIEGSEKQALLGGKQTICGYKPKLAVAGYHKTDDLWRIPQIILNYRNDYKIYLKSYMNHISFIYYCV